MALTKVTTGVIADSVTLTSPDINGGTIDGAVIGATSPAAGYFTGVYLGGATSANLLDDAEQGSWTPTLPNGGSLTVNSANYTKIGRQVTVTANLSSINTTANSSEFRIGGLPHTTNSSSNSHSAGSIGFCGGDDVEGFGLVNAVNGTYLYFHFLDGTSSSPVSNNDYRARLAAQNSGALILTHTYFTD